MAVRGLCKLRGAARSDIRHVSKNVALLTSYNKLSFSCQNQFSCASDYLGWIGRMHKVVQERQKAV